MKLSAELEMITDVASKTSSYCFGKFKSFFRKQSASQMIKSTLVIGASLNENRYSNICVKTLVSGHFPVTAIGLHEGLIDETPVLSGFPKIESVHTVTLYVGPQNQKPWYNYITVLNPKRVVFNPGTENGEFQNLLTGIGIKVIEDCTIMMVNEDRY